MKFNNIIDKKFITSLILFIIFLAINYRRQNTPFDFDSDLIRAKQYAHLKYYPEVAKNAFETGHPLLIKNSDGTYQKFVVGNDDPGYPLLLSYLSMLGFKIQDINSFARLNLYILWLAFLVLIFTNIRFFYTPLVAALQFYLITVYATLFGRKHAIYLVDHHGLEGALSIFSIIICIILARVKTFNWKAYVFIAFLAGIMSLFRNYFAYAVMAIPFAHMSYFIIHNKKWKHIPWAVGLLPILFLIQSLTFKYAQTISYAYASSYEKTVNSDIGKEPFEHGTWHTFYLGLGAYANKWNIEWSDSIGYDHADRYNAGLPANEKKGHYEVMKILYFKYLKENPVEALVTYSKKALQVTKALIKLSLRPLQLLLLLWITGILLLRKKIPLDLNEQFLPLTLTLTVTGLFFTVPIISMPVFSHATVTALYFTNTIVFGYLLDQAIPIYFGKILELKNQRFKPSSSS